jgi:hypothetical protein
MSRIETRIERLEQFRAGGEVIAPDKGLVQGMRERSQLPDEEIATRRARIEAMPDERLSPLARRMRARCRRVDAAQRMFETYKEI